MSHVDFKKYPMSCSLFCFSCHWAPCRMSILKNVHVAVSNLGVEGHMCIFILNNLNCGLVSCDYTCLTAKRSTCLTCTRRRDPLILANVFFIILYFQPTAQKRKKAKSKKRQFKSHNEHMGDILQDYSDKP